MPRFVIIFIGLFITAYLLRLSTIQPLVIPVDRGVKITGQIISQPYYKNNRQILQLENIYLTTDIYPEYVYGQKIEAVGYFTPQTGSILTAKYFSFDPQIKVVAENQTNLNQLLYKFRLNLEKKIKRLLPEPESSLFLGIMLGVKTNIPENFNINLRNSGTIHMLVASGQNVVLIAQLIFTLLILRLNRRLAVIFSLPVIIIYCLITGAEAPIVRAGIMAGFTLLATLTGRLKNQVWGLVTAAVIMLLVNPLTIIDVGFQFSFAATAGIIFIYPLLKQIVSKKFKLPAIIEESLLVSLSAQLTTLPLIVYYFGTLSLVSLPANILASPVVGLLMILGLPLLIISLLWTGLAQIFALLLYPLLWWFVGVVNFFGSPSWAVVNIESLSILWIVLWYGVLITIILFVNKKLKDNRI